MNNNAISVANEFIDIANKENMANKKIYHTNFAFAI